MKRPGVLGVLLLGAGSACAYANGYDPSRYASSTPAASVDPETEPLPTSPRRLMRDPRGTASARPVLAKPDVVDASAPDVAVAIAMVAPVVPPVADAAPAPTCGTKADPCPMQRFMHASVASAHTADSLTTAFTQVAGMSPDLAWSWVAIATRGANLANAGDLGGAKRQCVACHAAYREAYKAQYRTRPLQ